MDFMTRQAFENALEQTISASKKVIEAAENISNLESYPELTNKINMLENKEVATAANNCLNSLVALENALNEDIQTYAITAKRALEKRNALQEVLMEIGKEQAEMKEMREAYLKVVGAAAIVRKKPDDAVIRNNFSKAKENVSAAIRALLFTAALHNKRLSQEMSQHKKKTSKHKGRVATMRSPVRRHRSKTGMRGDTSTLKDSG